MTILYDWSGEAFDSPNFETKGSPVIDTTTGPPGNTKSMRMAMGGTGDRGYQSLSGNIYSMAFGGHYFHRVWMKMASDVAFSNQNKAKAGRWAWDDFGTPSLQTNYLLKFSVQPGEHGSGFTSDQGAGSGDEGPSCANYTFDPSANTAVQNWQQYIHEFKMHSTGDATDGWMKFYVYDANGNGGEIGTGLTGVRWFTEANRAGRGWVCSKAPTFQWLYPQDMTGNIWIARTRIATTFSEALESTATVQRGGGLGAGGLG